MEGLSEDQLKALNEVKEILKTFRIKSPFHGYFYIFRTWALILAFSVPYFYIDQFNLGFWTQFALYLVAIIGVSSCMRGLESCTHEATHNTMFQAPWANTGLQFLYSWPVLESVEIYRRYHHVHHVKFSQLDHDPTFQFYQEHGLMDPNADFKWLMIWRPLLGYHTLDFIQEKIDFLREEKEAKPMLAFWIVLLAAVHYFGLTRWFVLFWIVPLFLIFPVLIYWSEVGDHVSLDWSKAFSGTRNELGLVHTYWIHGKHDGYHLVHHIDAKVPGEYLKEAHFACLKKVPEYANMVVNSEGFLDTLAQLEGENKMKSKLS